MEHAYQINGQNFLEIESVQQHFADVNIALLKGAHIARAEKTDYYLFNVLDIYEDYFRKFYKELYGLNLVRETFDNTTYFYLDFPEDSKGKLYPSERHKELTELQTITGIVLMNMYYERYFEQVKTVTWSEIKKEILDGEYSRLYQKLFFGEDRSDFTDPEWDSLRRKFKNALTTFQGLGWISLKSIEEQEITFELRPAIRRFAKLYEHEIGNFNDFVNKVHSRK